MELPGISNTWVHNSPGQLVWQASNYIGARFRGTKDVIVAEVSKTIHLELAVVNQKITQQQFDRLVDLSFRDFTGLPERLKDNGADSISPHDFDELMDKIIRKHVSQHKLITIRPANDASSRRGYVGDTSPHCAKKRTPAPPQPPRPPPFPPRPFPGD